MKSLLCLLSALAIAGTARADAPPNIVLLYPDDWRADVIAAAGHPVVETPTIDRLAGEGMRFTRARVTTSICGVSRASIYSGQWMSRHGASRFVQWDTPWELSYLGLLREHGYHMGHVGKWHNRPDPVEHFDFARFYYGRHWYDDGEGGKIHVTTRNENDALEFLRTRPKDKPFYLTVAFFAPHAEDGHPDQFLPQPESMSLYEDVLIPVPRSATHEAWERLPPFFDERNEGRNRWTWRFDEEEKYQRMMKNYYRLVTEVDATCGRILEELEKQGVADNTLVIFTTDNGFFHGEHGLADKWYPHEESISVPLVVRDPRMPEKRRGTTNDDFVLNVDIAPMILAAAGIPIPEVMQGSDFAPLYLDDSPPEWRDEFFYEHPVFNRVDFIPASEALVGRDWKYFYWPDHDYEQLFNVGNDPFEQNDLARDPAHADRLAEMRARFLEHKAAAK